MTKPPRWREPSPLDTAIMLGGTILVIALAIIILILATRDGRAEERGEWFKSLKQPVTGASCCDIADCKQADAEWRGGDAGQWWAVVQGKWMAIPKEKELKRKSFDGEAYVCTGYDRRIYCFVPPIPST